MGDHTISEPDPFFGSEPHDGTADLGPSPFEEDLFSDGPVPDYDPAGFGTDPGLADLTPPDDWDAMPPSHDPESTFRRRRDNSEPELDIPAGVRADARSTWLSVAAAALQSGVPTTRARELLAQLRGADPLYRVVGEDEARQLKAALRTVDAILSDVADDGEVWLDQMGVFTSSAPSTRNLRELFAAVAKTLPASSPESALGGALFLCRKALSRDSAARLVTAIDVGADPEELGKIFGEILPPSAIEGTQLTENPSLRDTVREAGNRGELLTLSSGFRTLDTALHTRPDLPMGFIRGGQLVVMVAPSGAGKTSTIMGTVIVSMTTDKLRQGKRGRLIFVHNEDETAELFADAGISEGGRHEHLLDHIVALKTTSRSETVKMFYREILRAKRLSNETGLPVDLFMPPGLVVDYYQALTDGETSEVEATNKTADMLLYGIGNCDPVALAAITGISFQAYTGEAWPDGLNGYNLPVLATAQLLLKGNQKPFSGDGKDDWRGYATATQADTPAWEVRPGDYPLSKLDDIRGSTKIIQHATTIIGLHRSRPRNNPVVSTDENGFEQLADTRGYFTILKARYGQRMLVIPMEFNRQRNGGARAQYIDCNAEKAMGLLGDRMVYDNELFRFSGDPIIPVRPVPTRMKSITYRRHTPRRARTAA